MIEGKWFKLWLKGNGSSYDWREMVQVMIEEKWLVMIEEKWFKLWLKRNGLSYDWREMVRVMIEGKWIRVMIEE